jgi:hypothetical protein
MCETFREMVRQCFDCRFTTMLLSLCRASVAICKKTKLPSLYEGSSHYIAHARINCRVTIISMVLTIQCMLHLVTATRVICILQPTSRYISLALHHNNTLSYYIRLNLLSDALTFCTATSQIFKSG